MAGRCPVADETEQCRARAKGTEIMDDTIQHHKSDCNNTTTFYQQFTAIGHFALFTTNFSHHFALYACSRQVHAKMMPSKRHVETWYTRQDDAEVEPYYT